MMALSTDIEKLARALYAKRRPPKPKPIKDKREGWMSGGDGSKFSMVEGDTIWSAYAAGDKSR